MPRILSRRVVANLLRPSESLTHRVVSGGFWVLGLRGAQSVLNIVRLIVLARLLAPNDFGLLGIALLAILVLETFSQTGFQAALVQRKGEIRPYLDSAWTILVLRALAMFALLLLSAPFVASFFESPEAEPLIQVIGLSLVFQGFSNIGVVFFQKDLEFRRQAAYQLSGTLADFVVSIVAVLLLQNVWALIFGHVAGNLARLVMSFALHPYRPRFSLDFGKARELWVFGRWVAGSGMILFVIIRGVDIFVGKVLGVVALGVYQLAYQISNLPSSEITNVVSQVTFPAYSKLQSSLESLRTAYMGTLEAVSLIIFPVSGLIFVSAQDFTEVVLGEHWSEIIDPMRILALWGIVGGLAGLNGSILMAVNRPDIIAKLSLVRLAFLAVFIYPATMEWGLEGAAAVFLVSALLVTPNAYYIVVKRILGCGASSVLRRFALPAIGTLVMCAVVYALLSLGTSLLIFVVSICVGALTYLGVTLALERTTGLRAWGSMVDALRDMSR